jgi:hypothetical protein
VLAVEKDACGKRLSLDAQMRRRAPDPQRPAPSPGLGRSPRLLHPGVLFESAPPCLSVATRSNSTNYYSNVAWSGG